MAGLVGRVAIGKIRPLGTGSQNPHHAIEHLASVTTRPPGSSLSAAWLRKQRSGELPLEIRQIQGDVPDQGAGSFGEVARTGGNTVACARTRDAGF